MGGGAQISAELPLPETLPSSDSIFKSPGISHTKVGNPLLHSGPAAILCGLTYGGKIKRFFVSANGEKH